MAYTTKDLLELCKKIQNAELRKKVEEVIKSLTPSHPQFRLATTLEKAPAAPMARLSKAGGLIQHTIAVTETAEFFARNIKKNYGVDINIDYVVAGAILHDLYKTIEWSLEGEQYVTNEFHLGHLDLMTAELYARKFPKEIIHIVVAHIGAGGATPPMTYEALCVHYADSYAAVIETNVSRAEELEKQIAFVLAPSAPQKISDIKEKEAKEKAKKPGRTKGKKK